MLLYEMKFLVPNYSCLQNPRLEGYRPQIPVLYATGTKKNITLQIKGPQHINAVWADFHYIFYCVFKYVRRPNSILVKM